MLSLLIIESNNTVFMLMIIAIIADNNKNRKHRYQRDYILYLYNNDIISHIQQGGLN